MMQFQIMGESGYTQRCFVALDMVLSRPSEVHKAIEATRPSKIVVVQSE